MWLRHLHPANPRAPTTSPTLRSATEPGRSDAALGSTAFCEEPNNFGEGTSVPVDDVTPVAPVTKPEVTAAVPQIGGTVKVGKKLTADPGAWGPGQVALSYQWYRSGGKIEGATQAVYTLKAADKGKTITVKVTGKKAGYTTKSATSKATKKVG